MEVHTQYAGGYYAGYKSATKTTTDASFGEALECSSLEDAANQKRNWTKALSESKYTVTREATGEKMSAADVFKMLKETFIEEHKLT